MQIDERRPKIPKRKVHAFGEKPIRYNKNPKKGANLLEKKCMLSLAAESVRTHFDLKLE